MAPTGRRLCTQVVAAKKGKKGGGGNKKPASLLPPKPKLPYVSTDIIMHNLLLIESFARQLGRPMMDDADLTEIGKLLWEAPFGLISHDRYYTAGDEQAAGGGQGQQSPRVIYANKAALEALEAEWEAVVGQPLQALRVGADASQPLAEDEDSFGGQMASLGSGRTFKLLNVSAWKVEGPSGKVMGEAAVFDSWEYEDGKIGGPAAPPPDPEAPSAEQMEAAEAAVKEQAEVVRKLKQEQGLGNKDPEVVAQVEVLMGRKAALEALQQQAVEAAAAAAAAVAVAVE